MLILNSVIDIRSTQNQFCHNVVSWIKVSEQRHFCLWLLFCLPCNQIFSNGVQDFRVVTYRYQIFLKTCLGIFLPLWAPNTFKNLHVSRRLFFPRIILAIKCLLRCKFKIKKIFLFVYHTTAIRVLANMLVMSLKRR